MGLKFAFRFLLLGVMAVGFSVVGHADDRDFTSLEIVSSPRKPDELCLRDVSSHRCIRYCDTGFINNCWGKIRNFFNSECNDGNGVNDFVLALRRSTGNTNKWSCNERMNECFKEGANCTFTKAEKELGIDKVRNGVAKFYASQKNVARSKVVCRISKDVVNYINADIDSYAGRENRPSVDEIVTATKNGSCDASGNPSSSGSRTAR